MVDSMATQLSGPGLPGEYPVLYFEDPTHPTGRFTLRLGPNGAGQTELTFYQDTGAQMRLASDYLMATDAAGRGRALLTLLESGEPLFLLFDEFGQELFSAR